MRKFKEQWVRFSQWTDDLSDRIADIPGTKTFIVVFNIITITWVSLSIYAPWFPDPYPDNFYTMVVSWMAIVLSSFILLKELRRAQADKERKEREEALEREAQLLREERKRHEAELAHQQFEMTEAMLHLSESNQRILEYLLQQSNDNDRDLEKILAAIREGIDANERSRAHSQVDFT